MKNYFPFYIFYNCLFFRCEINLVGVRDPQILLFPRPELVITRHRGVDLLSSAQPQTNVSVYFI